MEKIRRAAVGVGSLVVAAGLGWGCRGKDSDNGTTKTDLIATSSKAKATLASLRERAGALLPSSAADGFRVAIGGLKPQFGAGSEKLATRLLLPERSPAPLHIEHATSDTSIDVRLRDVRDVPAEVADGYVVYRNALRGATLLHRPSPDGVEDFVSFETRPATPEIAYDVGMGLGAQGFRLTNDTLEVLDAKGAPRLRVSPPYLVGADGIRTDAKLSVAGCSFDDSPAPPWDRPVTAPGAKNCTVRVTWNDSAVVYPAILDPRWSTTASMGTARQEHVMVKLSDGRVLVAGGRSSNTSTTALATAELFDPASNTWSPTGGMVAARRVFGAVQLGSTGNSTTSGKVLVVGGLGGTAGTTSLSTAELFNPGNGTWTGAAALPSARHEGTTTLLASGQVLVAGGLSGTTVLNTAVRYNPASGNGTWTPVGSMATARRSHSATLLTVPGNATLNGKVLVVGGNSGTASLTSVQLFDGTSAWSTLTALSSAREGHTATVLANNSLLVAGGRNGATTLNTVLVFNTAGSGSWASASSMSTARAAHTATFLALPTNVVGPGQVLVAGGSNGTSALGSTEVFDGSNWSFVTALPSNATVQGHTAALLGSGRVLIAGGLSGTTVQSAARLYDPSNGLGCTANNQCVTGLCVDGVCCATTCSGACMACNVPGSVGTCAPKPAGTACSDGNACTTGETCQSGPQAGTCGGGGPVTCPGADQCHDAGTCNPVSGCAAATPKPDGTSCNDGHACTVSDSCQIGTCTGTATNTCTAPVMDFDTLGKWFFTSNGTVVGLNPNHTQGASSLEVKPHGFAPLVSTNQSSLGDVGQLALLDILLPTQQPNPFWYGAVQMYVSVPSLNIFNAYLGQVELTGLPVNKWQTIAFQLTPQLAAQLSGSYSDLQITIVLNVPEDQTATYLLDNLRFVSDVIPTLLGIATNSAGVTKAIFDYSTTNVTNISIPYGPANSLSNQSGFIAAPPELPPQVFVSATHPPFVATLGPNQLTWTVVGHSVTATAQSTPLPTTTLPDGTRVATLPDGRKINLDSVPPQDPGAAADPAVGARSFGTIPTKLDVSPSGGAVYSVPIAIPPGIAGMAPNLSLVYSSQGGDGIAGQGWELSGLSMIHRCPKTRVQDGFARPVTMTSLEPPPPSPNPMDGTVDGLCLDGKRLFQHSDGTYHLESEDNSVIKGHTDVGGSVAPLWFTVETKSGEKRYYGLNPKARVKFDRGPGPGRGIQIAIWALDRVIDAWGNYYDVHYNSDQEQFESAGLLVTQIDYTGKMGTSRVDNTLLEPAAPPFHSIFFGYSASRPDVRWMRFGEVRIPKARRLTSITTPLGTYTLTYLPDNDPMLPSRLGSVRYCAAGNVACLDDLVFDWEGGGYAWEEVPAASSVGQASSYQLPEPINTNLHCTSNPSDPCWVNLPGTQFVDLNGDGRADLVKSIQNSSNPLDFTSHAWINNGHGWTAADEMAPPHGLAFPDGKPTGAAFADLDGDGWLDLIGNGRLICPGGDEDNCFRHPAIWYSRKTFWEPDSGLFGRPAGGNDPVGTSTLPDSWHPLDMLNTSVADMNGDGRADLVRVNYDQAETLVVINTPGVGWVDAGNYYRVPGSIDNYRGWRPLHFGDLNRDGLADATTSSGGLQWMNQGPNAQRAFTGSSQFAAPANILSAAGLRYSGDIDGDGLFDSASFFNWPDLRSFSQPVNTGVFFSSGGFGFTTSGGTDAYKAALVPFEAPRARGNSTYGSMVDINGDGLADMVIAVPPWRPFGDPTAQNPFDPGNVWINNGTTWEGFPTVPNVPVVPVEYHPPGNISNAGDGINNSNGAAWIDLDGDGITDLVRYTSFGGGSRAWLNKFKRPIIKAFPNGIARKTQVTYATLTNADTQAQAIYQDSVFVTDGTSHIIAPLRVVASLKVDDGLETSSLAETKYSYSNLRGSASGRGPQGFSQTSAHDMRTDIITFTNYAQAYPYTGLPTAVLRATFGPFGTPIASTKTTYCDTVEDNGSGPLCSPMSGTTSDTVATSRFIYPVTVVDQSLPPFSNRPPPLPPAVLTTNTQLRYDRAGNILKTLVRTTSESGETYEKLTENVYASEQTSPNVPIRLGKLKQATVTSQRLQPPSGFDTLVRHVTAFDYSGGAFFSDSGAGNQNNTIYMLKKKRVEPGSLEPIELHTAYDYDGFGNVVLTKECATDFGHCDTDPSHVGPATLPFRTTTASYDPAAFTPPAGGGPIRSLGYGRGRFVVKTTNAAEHNEYSAFDPITGALVQKTGPNGLATCYTIDPFGHQDSQTERCGSDAPFTSTTLQYRNATIDLPLAKMVTVAKPASSDATWTYTDAIGRKVAVRRRGFDGRFIESAITYDAAGRAATETKPHFIGEPVMTATTTYDLLGRIKTVTQEMGVIRGSGTPPATTKLETTYANLTNHLDETVSGSVRRRSETKNALGKIASIKADGETIQYAYDGDGNLRFVTDPAGNVVETKYDARGRKERTIDPDLGTWRYEYNGFGDLVKQIDGKNQTTEMTYDTLGRMKTKTELAGTPQAGTAQWVYDVEPNGKGLLAAVVGAPDGRLAGPCSIPNTTLTNGNRAGRSYKYTKFGQLAEVSECADASTFVTSYTYDSLGRQSSVRYPAVNGRRQTVGHHYTSLGYLQYLTDDSQDFGVLWQQTSANALNQVIGETTRNGVETTAFRNPAVGWLMSTTSRAHLDGNKLIQNTGFAYDESGSLLSRSRSDEVSPNPAIETFTYDALNRVKTSQVTIPLEGYNRSESFDYDRLGNITLKDEKVYAYNAGCVAGARAAGPHAVCTVAGGAQYVYDGNGNMTTGAGRSVEYNAMNKPTRIQGVGGSVDFMYGAEGNRVVQDAGATAGRTVYVGLGQTGHSLYERTTSSSGTQHVHYVYAGGLHGGNPFALRIVAPDGSTQATKYYTFDHLGSVTSLSDETGRVATTGPNADVLAYDPWGSRRNPNGTEAPSTSFNLQPGRREFTGHETIPGVGLVNMNGRVYDPELGRFLSPDPHVQFTADLQSYNRYSYVLNNPLRSTDPTGYFLDEMTGIYGLDFTVGFVMSVGAVAACATGVGCAAVGILVALYQSTAMLAEGVPFGTVLAVNAISITAGLITGGISNAAGNSFAAALVVGAISSAGTAALTAYAMGGEISATDLLLAAAQGAAVAGFVWGVAPTKPVTQANVAEAQGGGGTGQAQVESDARSEVVAGASGPHDPIELGKNGNPVLVEGPRTPAQNEQDVLARKWLSSEAPQSGGRTVLEATTGKGIEYGVTKPVDGPMGPTKPGGKDAVSLHNYGAGKNAFGAHTHPPTGGPEFSNADLVAARGMGAPLYLGDPKGNLWVLDPVANTIMFVSGPPAYVPGTSALPDTSRFR